MAAEATVPNIVSLSTAARTAFTPSFGSLIYDSTLGSLFIGDGSTVGGVAASLSLQVSHIFTATQTFKSDGTHDTIDIEDNTGALRSSFDTVGFGFPFHAVFGLSITPPGGVAVPLAAGTDQTPHKTITRAGKIVKCYAEAKTGPVGAALVFDIYKSTDGGSTWATIWSTTANRIQIADGARTGTQTSFDVTSVAEGDLLRIDVVSAGSTTPGNDAVVTLFMLGRNLA